MINHILTCPVLCQRPILHEAKIRFLQRCAEDTDSSTLDGRQQPDEVFIGASKPQEVSSRPSVGTSFGGGGPDVGANLLFCRLQCPISTHLEGQED